MPDALKSLRPWANFAGCVLVIAVLYWTQAVLMPLALAILLTFLLTPVATRLQKWLGRVGSVMVTVGLTFAFLGLAGWGLTREATELIGELPAYRQTIREKLTDLQQIGRGGPVETVSEALDDIQTQMNGTETPKEPPPKALIVQPPATGTLGAFASSLVPVMGSLTTALFVITLVIFLLLERDAMRGRLIGLFGRGHLAVTTKAFEEAGRLVMHQLHMQTLINAIYGASVGLGLHVIGVPHAFLWAAAAFSFRFIPYVGPLIGAAAPILVALATMPGWGRPMYVVGLFIGLELFTNLVLETKLYADAAGVTPVALLVALAFWTWLWGPMGLLMGTPLTICFVVLGKHIPPLGFLSALMTEAAALPPDMAYYQRLLAHDRSEASNLIDAHVKNQSAETVYDALLVPALNYAERDRFENHLSNEDEAEVFDATRELTSDAAIAVRAARAKDEGDRTAKEAAGASHGRITVLAWPVHPDVDTLALRMFEELVRGTPIELDVLSDHMLASELVATIQERGCQLVCIADLPPSSSSKSRYLVKKLRAEVPGLTIVVGRWAPPALADDQPELLLQAGADHVASTMIETRDQLRLLALQKSGSASVA